MKEGTRNLLDKAARAIHAAEILVREGEREFGAGGAYYALFGQHFAKAGLMDSKYHRWLLGAFDRRLEGDYGFTVAMTQENVEAMIGQERKGCWAPQGDSVRELVFEVTQEGDGGYWATGDSLSRPHCGRPRQSLGCGVDVQAGRLLGGVALR